MVQWTNFDFISKEECRLDISENLRKNREIVEKNIEGCDDIVLCTAKLGKQGSIECFLVYPEQAVENVLL